MTRLGPRLEKTISAFNENLKRKSISTKELALASANLFKTAIEASGSRDTQSLILEIKEVTKVVMEAHRDKFIIENVSGRILDIVRGYETSEGNQEKDQLVGGIIKDFETDKNDSEPKDVKGKHQLFQEILDLIYEIEHSAASANGLSANYIHSREVLLTPGYSEMVLEFLKEAAKFRKFEVFVTESAPKYDGRKMAAELAKSDLNVTLIPDSCTFSLMERTNKVIFSPTVAFFTGALIAPSGLNNVLQAAKHHSVSVVALLELFKLSPVSVPQTALHRKYSDPSEIVSVLNPSVFVPGIKVENPTFDYVEGHSVSVFLTNLGGVVPASLFRLREELYNARDFAVIK